MISCQFICAPGAHDDFRAWDGQVDAYLVSEVTAFYGDDRLPHITRADGGESA